ncbi:MAG: alpha/beta fold hydrolase [Bacteroidetes bacterium]|nr:alpha/beta fold hydrolase [Bacteroidota bacterium]MCH8523638.1 alpha/beta fold hydrolase [Balneolales bacterium]
MEIKQLRIEVGGVWYHLHHFNSNITSVTPLIYLHGFGGSGALFNVFAEKLGRPVLAIDQLGHGQSDAPGDASRYRLKHQLRDIGSIITALSTDGKPADLLGYSMGGRLAMRLAVEYPNLFRSLIIESSHTGITSPAERENRMQRDHTLAGKIKADMHSFFTSWNRLPLFNSPDDAPADLAARFIQEQASNNPEGLANSLIGFGSGTLSPVSDELLGLQIPLAVITGELDSVYTTMWESHPNIEHIVVQGAGHRVHLDRPDAYIQHINNFLNHLDTTS